MVPVQDNSSRKETVRSDNKAGLERRTAGSACIVVCCAAGLRTRPGVPTSRTTPHQQLMAVTVSDGSNEAFRAVVRAILVVLAVWGREDLRQDRGRDGDSPSQCLWGAIGVVTAGRMF